MGPKLKFSAAKVLLRLSDRDLHPILNERADSFFLSPHLNGLLNF